MELKLSPSAEDALSSKLPNTTVPLLDLEQALQSDGKDGLCDSCLSIDFVKIFSSKVGRPDGRWEACIGSPSRSSQCRLCRFFADMATKGESEKEEQFDVFLQWRRKGSPYFLKAFSIDRAFGLSGKKMQPTRDKHRDQVLLTVLPGWLRELNGPLRDKWKPWKNTEEKPGFILLAQSSEEGGEMAGRRLSSSAVQWDVVRNWIALCKKRHGYACFSPIRSSLVGFKVIDCETREIVAAHRDCKYTALSYVWGEKTPDVPARFTSILPDKCPQVVEDALQVTKQLKERYLWIDRYCIDQENMGERHLQIANMDSVYAGSFLTIIAAAGDDSSYGLPGVSTTLRKQQPCVVVQNTCLVSSLPDPAHVIGGSKWMSRGWTYQEGILAKRRLIFTDYQVYYQCMGRHCFESMRIPLDYEDTESNGRVRDQMVFSRVFPRTSIGRTPEDFLQRINEYSKKSLSYESDTLNAILGVLKVFEKASLYHHWGLPLFRDHAYCAIYNWINTYVTGLMWKFDQPAERRHGFPSWSWVGWKDWKKLRYFDHQGHFCHANLHIGITSHDGISRFWLTDANFDPLVFNKSSASLTVTGDTLMLEMIKSQSGWEVPEVTLWYGSRIELTRHVEEERKTYKALLLGVTLYTPQVACLLLLEPVGDAYERVGVCYLRLTCYYGHNREHYQAVSGDGITIEGFRFNTETLILA